jgi:hypothetical protein
MESFTTLAYIDEVVYSFPKNSLQLIAATDGFAYEAGTCCDLKRANC